VGDVAQGELLERTSFAVLAVACMSMVEPEKDERITWLRHWRSQKDPDLEEPAGPVWVRQKARNGKISDR
jgi:hypothetical protein